MNISAFQNWLYEKNCEWHFTDGTLCVLWCVKFPEARSDYAKRHRYIASTRRDYNKGGTERRLHPCHVLRTIALGIQSNRKGRASCIFVTRERGPTYRASGDKNESFSKATSASPHIGIWRIRLFGL